MKRALLAIALAAAAAAAVYLALAWRGEPGGDPAHVEVTQDRPEDMPPDHLARRDLAQRAGETAIASGETLELDVDALGPGQPLVLRLLLAEPSRTADPLATRLYTPDGRTLELESALGPDRMDARVEIDPSFLARGRYVVEVRTTEQSHLPLRRYAIEVK